MQHRQRLRLESEEKNIRIFEKRLHDYKDVGTLPK